MPINDNLLNATAIGGISGSIDGTNVGATAQIGEPANNGKTVWYRWQLDPVQISRFFYFSTLSTSPLIQPKALHTALRVFSTLVAQPTFADLVEVTYIFNQDRYAAYNSGSLVAFMAFATDSSFKPIYYYVKIDGLNGDEGGFTLNWDEYAGLRLSSCLGCMPDAVISEVCMGSFLLPTASGPGSYNMGSFPAGNYVVRYCTGAWDQFGNNSWTVDDNRLGSNGFTHSLDIDYNGGNALFNFQPGARYYHTQQDARLMFQCTMATFKHSGGAMTFNFRDTGGDNTDGSPLPTFEIYRFAPALVFSSASCTWLTATRVRGIFSFSNPSIDAELFDTVTLRATGGVVNPSAAKSNIGVGGKGFGDTVSLQFDFDTTPSKNTEVTATIDFVAGTDILTFPIALSPIITASGSVTQGNNQNCSIFGPQAGKYKTINIGIKNLGNIATNNLTSSISTLENTILLSGLLFAGTSNQQCFETINEVGGTLTPGQPTPNGGIATFSLNVKPPPVPTTVTFKIRLGESGGAINYPTLLVPFTVNP